ncbi:MAG: DUF3047 domain-containing protein [Deltaproteobacteria bacterium]|nr:DUF3047 domain-containing protein [Deltaproteobacteria bacterium]
MRNNIRVFFSLSLILGILLGIWGLSCAEDLEIISVAGFKTDTMKSGAPEGWKLEENKGIPYLKLEKEGDRFALHLKSDKSSSFGIRKELKIDPAKHPFLNWKWKAVKLPLGGDVRDKNRDDQAIQIYVAFEATGWPAKLNTPVIGYIWDNEAPRDTVTKSQQILADKVRYIVLRDKSDDPNEWHCEKRNVGEDYKKLFSDIDDGRLRKIEGISIYINSQHTESEAESYVYDIFFSRQ